MTAFFDLVMQVVKLLVRSVGRQPAHTRKFVDILAFSVTIVYSSTCMNRTMVVERVPSKTFSRS